MPVLPGLVGDDGVPGQRGHGGVVRDDALQRGTLELIVGPAVRDPPESDPRGAADCKLHERERLPPESCDVAHGGICEREVSRGIAGAAAAQR